MTALEALAPPPGIALRLCAAGDVPQIHAIVAGIFAEYGDVFDTQEEMPQLAAPHEYFAAVGGAFWVATRAQRVVGMIGAYPLDRQDGELKSLYVAHEARCCGLGACLTRHCVRFLQQRGHARVVLWSDTRFTAAHRLYERLGFRRHGRREVQAVNTFAEYGYELVLERPQG